MDSAELSTACFSKFNPLVVNKNVGAQPENQSTGFRGPEHWPVVSVKLLTRERITALKFSSPVGNKCFSLSLFCCFQFRLWSGWVGRSFREKGFERRIFGGEGNARKGL